MNKNELAFAIKLAVGYDSVGQFAGKCKMVDAKMLADMMKGNINELPNRKLLRKIADNSEGRITYKTLYDICGYKESDPEEDKGWKDWTPKRGQVYMIDLGYNLDCEQSGVRPALVIQNDVGNKYSPTTVICPLSSRCKGMTNRIHVKIPKELGVERESYVLTEQIRVVSKRRFFYNDIPWHVTTLPEFKMKEIQYALEFELGLTPLMFNESDAFKMIEHIKSLKKNIKTKKSLDLVDIFHEKVDVFVNYCHKYDKDYNNVIKEHARSNTGAVCAT